jgi:hypothetical protein
MRFFSPAILQPYRAELNTSIVAASKHGPVSWAALPSAPTSLSSPHRRPRPKHGLKAGSKLLPYLRYLNDQK